jgi:ABC-type branched-subunit amino acid transport system permease subunit
MARNIRPAGVFDTSYQQDIAIFRTPGEKLFWGGVILILLFLPLLVYIGLIPHIWIGTIMRLGILIIAIQGLNILVGYTGQISLGHSAFTAVGAYTGAILARQWGVSFWIALPVSALFTGLVGLLFGLPSLRVKGFYLAMATLAAQFIIPWVLEHPLEHWTNGSRPLNVPAPVIGPFPTYETFGTDATQESETRILIEGGHPVLSDYMTVVLTGDSAALPTVTIFGADGIELPESALTTEANDNTTRITFIAAKEGRYTVVATPSETSAPYTMQVDVSTALSFASEGAFYFIAMPVTLLMLLAGHNIIRSRTGRAFISIRDNDLAAELLGINIFAYKLQAFFLSAVYAGVSGTLLAYETNSLSLDFFSLTRSIEMLAMVIIGGAGFPLGAIFGAAFFNLFNDVFIPAISPFLRDILPRLLPFVDVVNIYSALNPVLFGLALMTFLILEPRGLAYRWEILQIAWKIRPYSY